MVSIKTLIWLGPWGCLGDLDRAMGMSRGLKIIHEVSITHLFFVEDILTF